MDRDDPQPGIKEENSRLREALQQCRELLKRTEEVLNRAHRNGTPQDDRD